MIHGRTNLPLTPWPHAGNGTKSWGEYDGSEEAKASCHSRIPGTIQVITKIQETGRRPACAAHHDANTTLNGSDPPFSSPANTAPRTAPKYSASLRPSARKKSSYSLYRESATTLTSSSATRRFLHAHARTHGQKNSASGGTDIPRDVFARREQHDVQPQDQLGDINLPNTQHLAGSLIRCGIRVIDDTKVEAGGTTAPSLASMLGTIQSEVRSFTTAL